MAPKHHTAELTLTYPIYAADFDPYNNAFLVVGGGGGESKSGVKNKISLVNAAKKEELSELVDIDLSSGEDAVTSLAVAQADEGSAVVLAGINSSTEEQAAGRNEHLRSFRLGYPARRRPDEDGEEKAISIPVKTEALSKAALFSPAASDDKHETYQRLLRLSRSDPENSRRVGVAATGLAPNGEIVVFDASNPRPSKSQILRTIELGKDEEAADVDVIARDEDEYLVAYCTPHHVYACVVSTDPKQAKKPKKKYLLHGTPHPDVFADKMRPTFRSLRFLTPRLILLARNRPKRAGAELLLLEVPAEPIEGTVTLQKRLHRRILGVATLAAAPLAGPLPNGPIQHAIAVAGQDRSLTILTLDHDNPLRPPRAGFKAHTFLRDVHPLPPTALAFSAHRPVRDRRTAPVQYLKLASASPASTVVLHTFALTPYPADPSKHSERNPTRYALRPLGRTEARLQDAQALLIALVCLSIGALFLQAFVEIRGGTREILGAKAWLPEAIRDKVSREYMFAGGMPEPLREQRRRTGVEREGRLLQEGLLKLRDALAWRKRPAADGGPPAAAGEKPKAMLVTEHAEKGLTAQMVPHDEAPAQEGRLWDELEEHERSSWRRKMMDAGVWAVEEGESVLKGELLATAELNVV